ncbi:MAG: hypothetical protein EBQ80_05955 [Proteobacteria bacterium]|nr:hypothetical protein [Pseudomonadota bacterium]
MKNCAKYMMKNGGLWWLCHMLLLAWAGVLTACGGVAPELPVLLKKDARNSHTWQMHEEQAGAFTLAVAERGGGRAGDMTRIYIEGDGRAYITSGQPSGNPTPHPATGLQLAMADVGAARVVYLARPCQFAWAEMCKFNNYKVWTTERFTEEVVIAYVELVERLSAGQPVEVVGFSGGGFIAAQLAARLSNVVRFVTVAGNVLPNEVNAWHKVMQLEVAAWPAGFGRLAQVPQLHVVGLSDKIVAPQIVESYLRQVQPSCARVVKVAAGHLGPWEIESLLREKDC